MSFIASALFLFASVSLAAQPRTIIEFPNPTWLENLASTRNGTILTGTLGGAAAELHLVDPFAPINTSSANSTPIHTFPGVNSVFGIAEYETDIFAVITSNFSGTTGPVAGTYSVWSVDLSNIPYGVKTNKITDLPDAKLLNGMTTLNSHTVLLGDSFADHVLALHVKTGKYEVVLEDPSLAGNTSLPLGIGVNGLDIVDNNLYYSNFQLGVVGRVPVDRITGHATGAFTILATNQTAADDLAVTDDGTVFFGRLYPKTVVKISPDGTVATFVDGHKEGEAAVSGATSVALGRTTRDRGVAYLSTFGGYSGENGDGELLGGGKIVAIDLY
ncbi:hypothetical protein CC80DRAFT_487287 [Byssothecium circinans]|uniref:NHL repeat-containing protein n=1 Tax=Byssothecium circinans TaxID=147558 RepID=A0A6A5UIT1_9PLEO|nr:hypothetical protein CC80DRAFT_487287 [Byssothecium circinans]